MNPFVSYTVNHDYGYVLEQTDTVRLVHTVNANKPPYHVDMLGGDGKWYRIYSGDHISVVMDHYQNKAGTREKED